MGSGDSTTVPYASALSEHRSAHVAADDTARDVLAAVGSAPDLAVVFVTSPHREALGEVAGLIRSVLEPRTLLGATAVAVVGPRREVETTPGVTLFAARLQSLPVAVRFQTIPAAGGVHIATTVGDLDAARSLVLVADPFTFPVGVLLDGLGESAPRLSVIGGLASAAESPGGNRLVLDDDVFTDGAVGVLLGEDVSLQTVVSQGCRPIGSPYVVTRAEGRVIYELAGRPALERLVTTLDHLRPEDSLLASRGVHCGLVVDERKEQFGRGDFLIRAIVSADRSAGAVLVGDVVPVGSTVQFQVRDAASADEDLRELLDGRRARGALLFSCNGRGRHMFGLPDHDATVVSDLAGVHAMAGMFCAGELGPVGGRNAVHGYTASVAFFP